MTGKPAEVRSITAQADKPQRAKDDKTIAVAEEFNRTGFNSKTRNRR
ncbi:hypothetical protein [Micromonospora sediminicola]